MLRVLRTEKGPHPCQHADCGRAVKTFSAVQVDDDEEEPLEINPLPQQQQQQEEEEEEEEKQKQDETHIAWLIRQCAEYAPPDDIVCPICTFAYDYADRQPVRVSKCYAIRRDPYNEDETVDRGELPGCGHVICNKCMQSLLLSKKDECYFCRGCVKESEVAEDLLRPIVENTQYAALTARLNDALSRNDLAQNVDISTLQTRAEDYKKKAAELARELLRVNSQLADTKKNHEIMANQLQMMTSMNGALFDEIIDLRLERRDPARLGITVARSGDSIYFNVHLQSRSIPQNEQRSLMYARTVDMIDKPAMSAVREIAETVRRQTELPDQAVIDASYIDVDAPSLPVPGTAFSTSKHSGNGSVTLVERGSWLHSVISSADKTPESVLAGVDDEETGKVYQRVSRAALDSALGQYRRARSAATSTAGQNRSRGSGEGQLRCIEIGPYMYRVPAGLHTRLAVSISRENIDSVREQLTGEIAKRKMTHKKCDATIATVINDILTNKYQGDAVISAWRSVEKRMQLLTLLWEIASHHEAPQIFMDHPPACFVRHEIDIPDAVFSKMTMEQLDKWKDCLVKHRRQYPSAYPGKLEYIETLLSVDNF